ncbi:mevalonate kinase [Candidatus Gottesmanbacteria bacterium]|nr:mevalonate kinase [Candidatus Gottesmanbacteria bacterium]
MIKRSKDQKIKVSAPGKLLLFGDHAVVYGYPCIVTAMDTRMYVTVEFINGNNDQVIAPQVKETKFVIETLNLFKKKFNINSSVKVTTNGDFSHRVGLGSSSAVTVALVEGLSKLFNINLSKGEIFKLSYQIVLNIQKVGSGFDVAAATYGGIIYYIKGGKKIEKIKSSRLPLVVGYSGVKADTPTLINKVRQEYNKSRAKLDSLFKQMTLIVDKASISLKNKDYQQLGLLMTKNHNLLQKLGVSTPLLDKMCKSAISNGAWGAKLSGAGGGDCMIALVNEDRKKSVEKAITESGGEIINVKTNAEGVRTERDQ